MATRGRSVDLFCSIIARSTFGNLIQSHQAHIHRQPVAMTTVVSLSLAKIALLIRSSWRSQQHSSITINSPKLRRTNHSVHQPIARPDCRDTCAVVHCARSATVHTSVWVLSKQKRMTIIENDPFLCSRTLMLPMILAEKAKEALDGHGWPVQGWTHDVMTNFDNQRKCNFLTFNWQLRTNRKLHKMTVDKTKKGS